jgi:hypothetical protein
MDSYDVRYVVDRGDQHLTVLVKNQRQGAMCSILGTNQSVDLTFPQYLMLVDTLELLEKRRVGA